MELFHVRLLDSLEHKHRSIVGVVDHFQGSLCPRFLVEQIEEVQEGDILRVAFPGRDIRDDFFKVLQLQVQNFEVFRPAFYEAGHEIRPYLRLHDAGDMKEVPSGAKIVAKGQEMTLRKKFARITFLSKPLSVLCEAR